MKKLGFIFTGQGAQALNMGKSFYENCAKSKELLENASEHCKINFKALLFSENENLNKSEFTQPAVMLASLMAFLAFNETMQIKAQIALGHSLGEFSALAVRAGLNYLDALLLVHKRGQFMQEACKDLDAGMMVVLGLDDFKAEALCKEAQVKGLQIYAANYNCDGQIVIAGLKKDLQASEAAFKEAGAKRAMLLNMNVASHCPLLEPASLKLKGLLEPILSENFQSVISNATAKPYSSKEEALDLLPKQLTSPVHYKQSILGVQDSVDAFVEFGFNTLSNLNKKITQKPSFALLNMQDIENLVKELEG